VLSEGLLVMKPLSKIGIFLLISVLLSSFQFPEARAEEMNSSVLVKPQNAALAGHTIQIDPTFAYYQNRSVESIADELVQNGFQSAHYFVVNENNVNRELVEALQSRGLKVWAMVLGNGSYSVAGFPSDWPEWQMELLQPPNDGYYRFSPHSESYVKWKKERLAKLVTEIPFDGIEIAEPYFPEWNGIERGVYGDIGPLAQAAFLAQYGKSIPNFTDPVHPDYYQTNLDLYADWVNFRVDAVNNFLNEVINGEGGVRDARKDILVATWSLAIDAGPASVDVLREIQGLDAAKMITAVKPDIHFLQTHWPDWMKSQADLPPHYINNYQNFVDQIRAVHPDLPLGVQADIGSGLWTAKDRYWYDQFGQAALANGYSTWTAYEYHIGGYMYQELPVPVTITRPEHDTVVISFQKRIDEASAKQPGNLRVLTEMGASSVDPADIQVDGNQLIIRSDQLPKKEFKLRIENVTDTPQSWQYNKTQPANSVAPGTIVNVDKKNH